MIDLFSLLVTIDGIEMCKGSIVSSCFYPFFWKKEMGDLNSLMYIISVHN